MKMVSFFCAVIVSSALGSTSTGVLAQEAQLATSGPPVAAAEAAAPPGAAADPNAPASVNSKAIAPAVPAQGTLAPALQTPTHTATVGGEMECHDLAPTTGTRFGARHYCGQRRQWQQAQHDAQWSLSRMQMQGMITYTNQGP